MAWAYRENAEGPTFEYLEESEQQEHNAYGGWRRQTYLR